jgi:hypothetical protein
MEVFADLLPPSYTAKTEPSAKDSRRQRQQGKSSQQEAVLDSEQDTIKITTGPIIENERRAGDDRRQQQTNRGRWLESRDRNDRRAIESAIFVKV